MRRTLIGIISVLVLINCSRMTHQKPLSTENVTVLEITRKIEQNYRRLSNIKGNAQLSIETPGMGFTAVSDVVLKMPDSLFLHVRAGFGMGIGSIFIAKDQFAVYSSIENKVYYGDINSFDLSHFFQINLRFQDLIELIAGTLLINETKNSFLSIDQNKYLISIKTAEYIKKYWVDPKKFVVTDFHVYNKKGELVVKQEFRQFSKEHGIILPKLIRLNHPLGNERVTFLYTDRKTNGTIKSKDFNIKFQDNTQKIIL